MNQPGGVYQCRICRYWVEIDDVVIGNAARGVCVCLACYLRETAESKPVKPTIRREINREDGV